MSKLIFAGMMEDSDLKAGSQGWNKSQDLSEIGSKNHFFP